MTPAALEFLKQLLHTPSPSGYEQQIQGIVREYVRPFADRVTTDLHGNVIAAVNPEASVRVMLAGHCDQIGLIVQYVDKDGYLSVQPIGGWDVQMLIGQRLTVWSKDGPRHGVIARKAIHLLTEEERRQVPKMHDLALDIGAKNQEEALKWVRIGDPVTLALGYFEMPNQLAFAPAMDDKTGLWVVVEALRRAKERGLSCGLFAVSTVQEEIGLRGARTSAYGIDPQIGIAVDVTHATDTPSIDKRQEGEIYLGRGPVIFRGPNMSPRVVDGLLDVAASENIPFQLGALARASGTDANAIQISRAGVATALVSIPNRYMHSPVEMISLEDIDRAADLLAGYATRVNAETNLVP